jgi:hypothetical protein
LPATNTQLFTNVRKLRRKKFFHRRRQNGGNVKPIYEVTVFGDVRLLSLTLDALRHNLYFMTHVTTLESLGKVQILRCSIKKVVSAHCHSVE